jgi:molybdopterin-guanine dinucleotide biosynthesis protein A
LIRQLIQSFVGDAEIVSAAGEPLCAVYSPNVLPPAREALLSGRLRVRDLLARNPRHIAVSAPTAIVWNANTPEDWAAR